MYIKCGILLGTLPGDIHSVHYIDGLNGAWCPRTGVDMGIPRGFPDSCSEVRCYMLCGCHPIPLFTLLSSVPGRNEARLLIKSIGTM